MFELLIGALATATAARVFVPDAVRLVRRGLAAGVMVGVASLTERGRVDTTSRLASETPFRTGQGERA